MKKIAAIFICALISFGLSAQEPFLNGQNNPESKMTKKERRKAELHKEYKNTEKMIDSMGFVLEANYLSNLSGLRRWVYSNLNFVGVDSAYSVLQVGSNTGIGLNGVGGVTVEGTVIGWKVIKDSVRKTFYVSWSINTNLGHYDIAMSVSAGGSASAYISGLTAGKLTYDGNLVRLSESSAYKGRAY